MLTKEELKHMKEAELDSEMNRSEIDLYKLSLAVASRQSKETSKLKALRRYIARIKTLKRMLAIERPDENKKSAIVK